MIRLYYDDNELEVLDKINLELQRAGLELVDDDEFHDGYIELTLVGTNELEDLKRSNKFLRHRIEQYEKQIKSLYNERVDYLPYHDYEES